MPLACFALTVPSGRNSYGIWKITDVLNACPYLYSDHNSFGSGTIMCFTSVKVLTEPMPQSTDTYRYLQT